MIKKRTVPRTTAPNAKAAPLAAGDQVQVVAAIYSAVKVGTFSTIKSVRRDRAGLSQHLYELDCFAEYYFWRRELRRLP